MTVPSIEVSIILNVGGTEKALGVAAGAAHFVTSAFFEERLFAIVAFADEGLGHGFFDLVFCI